MRIYDDDGQLTPEFLANSRLCPGCGARFLPHAAHHTYCESACQVRSWRRRNGKRRKPEKVARSALAALLGHADAASIAAEHGDVWERFKAENKAIQARVNSGEVPDPHDAGDLRYSEIQRKKAENAAHRIMSSNTPVPFPEVEEEP